MSIFRLKKLTLAYGEHQILRDIFFRLGASERVALMGSNGSGKSSILKLIVRHAMERTQGTQSTRVEGEGEVPEVDGEVELNHDVKVGYFSQFSRLDDERSVEEILLDTFSEIRAWETELSSIEVSMGEGLEGDELQRLLLRQGDLFELMTQRDGWSYANNIDTVLTKLGFSGEHRTRPVGELSGGWRNRASLAQILLEEPDLLLLDEPTNFLDVEGIAWLEGWIARLPGAVIAVSHDRHFLDSVVSRMVEIQNYRLHEYSGSYADYVREKASAARSLSKEFRHEEELLLFEASTISSRKRARSGEQLAKKKARIKRGGETPTVDSIVSGVYAKLHIPQALAEFNELSSSRGGCLLFEGLSFELKRGDRVIIVGRNACGKSTLLQVIMQELKPDTGEVIWKPGVRFSSFTQVLEELDPSARLLQCAMTAPQQFLEPHEMPSQKSVLRFLRMMGFSELDLQLRVSALSGGQRARLALAWCLTSGPAVVILDEPTNHLDIRSAQIMERALAKFPGAVLAVSHDRFFVDKVARRLLVFEEGGKVALHGGGWTAFDARRARKLADARRSKKSN
ncbi:MAG: ABC-F family ATP-binding cassette domain-containing protein [Deltaproteobacteria bacterium]|nr:ABC-F family ATP-binding cassette domain-containing protein [Deltaproteobacteria bacterium]